MEGRRGGVCVCVCASVFYFERRGGVATATPPRVARRRPHGPVAAVRSVGW